MTLPFAVGSPHDAAINNRRFITFGADHLRAYLHPDSQC
jgi:hypothetical protein